MFQNRPEHHQRYSFISKNNVFYLDYLQTMNLGLQYISLIGRALTRYSKQSGWPIFRPISPSFELPFPYLEHCSIHASSELPFHQ